MSGEEVDVESVLHEVELSGDSYESSITEPAPPTYEEALQLFVRETSFSEDANADPAASELRRAAAGEAACSRSESDLEMPRGFEFVPRRNSEELGRSSTLPSMRSSPRSQPRGRSASNAEEVRARAMETANSRRSPSVMSAPGDLGHAPPRLVYRSHYPTAPRPTRALQTIHEGEELTIEITPTHTSDEDSFGKASCYYTCFGFPTFTSRLSPALRNAWTVGLKHMTEMSLPVFSTKTRYALFSMQALITVACIVLSFFSTSFENENIVRLVSLAAVFVVNLLERLVYWFGCCDTIKESYDAYSDITRNFLTELFLYPAVIASIMNTLKMHSYNAVVSLWDPGIYKNTSNTSLQDDAINLSLNGLVLVLFVFVVSFLRLVQLGSIARSLLSKCKERVSRARRSSQVFIVGFFLHVLAATIVQFLFLFLIGSRIQSEMSDIAHPTALGGVSVYLLIMMVCGELVPFVGTFLYFLSMQKWLEEFPIVLLLDHTPGSRTLSNTNLDQVEWKFKALHASNNRCTGCVFGFIHPLMSPVQMLINMAFSVLWILFVFSFPVRELSSSSVELSLAPSSSSSPTVVIYMTAVYGFSVLFSFLVNVLPITYGFLGVVVLPFWVPFYCCVACYSLCYNF